jgi:hypothetical protein
MVSPSAFAVWRLMTSSFATVELGRPLRYDATSACRACPLKQQCTRNTGGRRLTRGWMSPCWQRGSSVCAVGLR